MKFTGIAIILNVCIQASNFQGIDVNLPLVGQSVAVGTGTGVNVGPTEKVTFGREDCKSCTNFIENNIVFIQRSAAQFNFAEFTAGKVPLCYKCVADGLETISRYGDSCVSVKPTAPNTTITKSNYQWKFMNVTCECALATTPLGLMDQLRLLTESCPGGTTTLNAPGIKFDNFGECSPPSNIDVPAMQNVTISMYRNNPKGSITVEKNKNLKGPDSVTVIAAGIIETNMTAINATCHSNSTTFNMCNCLYTNNLVITILEQLIEIYTQCVDKSDSNQFRSALDSYCVCTV